MSERGEYAYDVFISYSRDDEGWVTGTLLPRLENAGLRVCIGFRDFEAGVPSLVNIERAVENSRHTLVVLTPAWVARQWTDFESLLVGTSDPAGRRRKLIPLMLKSCKPPVRIAMLTFVDFTRADRLDVAWTQLLSALGTLVQEPGESGYPVEAPAPFVGPIPFRPEHAPVFFGRKQCLARLFDRLMTESCPLLVINGLSGVGKTSLLRAGLIPLLRAKGHSVAYTRILNNPLADVVQGILREFPATEDRLDVSVGILQALDQIAGSAGRPFYLIVDQLERCFTLAHGNGEARFWTDMARLVGGEARCPVQVIVAVRADWLYYLQNVSPDPLGIPVFDFLFFVNPLNQSDAKEALLGPLERFHIAYEAEMVDVIVKDLASPEGYVNPPQLQIVGEALYRYLRDSAKEEKLTLQSYDSLGRARTIIREHLVNAVDNLGPSSRIGWQVLLKLVGPDNQRVSRQEENLRGNLSLQDFDRIMNYLVNARLVVRELSSVDQALVYTLTHDYLIEEINEHFKGSLELQAWRTAERYLDAGLADWRHARSTTKQELLLEKDRYLHICDVWSQGETLTDLSEEANEFLLRTGLYHGESSFSYWLCRLPDDRSQSAMGIVADYALYRGDALRESAQKAVAKAIRENLLSEEHQKHLQKQLWTEFLASKSTREVERADQAPQLEDTGLPRKEQTRESAATLLWKLRNFASFSEKSRFAPTAARLWMADHRTQILLSVASALLVIVLLLASWGIRERLRGRWYPVNTLFAGQVSAAALHPAEPDTVYIVTSRGPAVRDGATLLWHRGKGKWEILSQSFTRVPVMFLLVTYANGKPRIYASVLSIGILRSDDNGTSWKLINVGLGSYVIRALVADPANPEVIYAGAGDKRGVFESQDGGNTWVDISGDELFGASILSMAYTAYEGGTLLAGTDDGRIVARRRGELEWELVSAYPGVGRIACLSAEPEEGKYVYAGTIEGQVLLSPNGGVDWILANEIPGVFEVDSIAVPPGEPNVIYLAAFGIGGYMLWKGEDYGQSWHSVSNEQFTRELTSWLLVPRQDPGKLYAAGQCGFFETQDGGNTWRFHGDIGSPLASVETLAISPFEGGPTYAAVVGSIYSSLDPEKGMWKRGNGLLAVDVRCIVADPLDARIAYAGVYLTNKWSVFLTKDGGETWQPSALPPDIPERYLHDTTSLDIAKVNDGTILYVGTNGCGVLHTTDRGASWETWGRQDCVLPQSAPKNVGTLAIDPYSADILYVAADRDRIFVTRDRGKSWQSYPVPLESPIIGLKVDPRIKGRVYLIAGSDGFWRSEDGAKTWKRYSKGLEEKSLSAMMVAPGAEEILFVGSTHGEVWKTTDGGRHWRLVREELAVVDISTMAARNLEEGVLLGSASDRGGGIYRYQPGSLLNSKK